MFLLSISRVALSLFFSVEDTPPRGGAKPEKSAKGPPQSSSRVGQEEEDEDGKGGADAGVVGEGAPGAREGVPLPTPQQAGWPPHGLRTWGGGGRLGVGVRRRCGRGQS